MPVDEQMEITVKVADVPRTIQLEEGIDTTLADEKLLAQPDCLVVRKVYAKWRGTRPPSPKVRLVAADFDQESFQNLCSKSEQDLNNLGETLRLSLPRSGRGVTNKSKRQALREKAR